MDLYKEMTAEAATLEKCKNGQGQPLPSEINHGSMKAPDNKPVISGQVPEKQQPEDLKMQGFVVGGSAFGWNFITCPTNTTVYYGRTKEAFRLAKAVPQ